MRSKYLFTVKNAYFLLLAMILNTSSLAYAQNASPQNIGQCADITDAQARLVCYDSFLLRPALDDETPVLPASDGAAGASVSSSTAAAAVVVPVEVEKTLNAAGSVENSDSAKIKERATEEIYSTITSLRKRGDGKWIISLSNDQTWIQTVGTRFSNFQRGQDIKIYPSLFGGTYRLKAVDVAGFIQVARLE